MTLMTVRVIKVLHGAVEEPLCALRQSGQLPDAQQGHKASFLVPLPAGHRVDQHDNGYIASFVELFADHILF